jgi:hypothetical protein
MAHKAKCVASPRDDAAVTPATAALKKLANAVPTASRRATARDAALAAAHAAAAATAPATGATVAAAFYARFKKARA